MDFKLSARLNGYADELPCFLFHGSENVILNLAQLILLIGFFNLPVLQIMNVIAGISQRFQDVRRDEDGLVFIPQAFQENLDDPASLQVNAIEGFKKQELFS